jgi:uncharacterized protein (DUF4213/DUF364 family)/nucleoside-triphosphatase THEP1
MSPARSATFDTSQLLRRASAPTPLPGVVVYSPNSLKSQVLAAFAADLQARGWRVGGVVIDTLYDEAGQKSGLDLVDLATGRHLPYARPETTGIAIGRWVLDPATLAEGDRIIRQAVEDGAELVVVDKFGPLESRGEGFAPGLRAALAAGRPLLVAVRGEFLDGWDAFADRSTTILRAETAALWRWWGPYRLYQDLARGVAEAPARQVVIGVNWTLVEGPDGCGLAHSPSRDAPGCRSIGQAGAYAGRSLRELAALASSWNPLEAALGLAAINAHYNRRDVGGIPVNGLELFARAPGRKLVVGRFPELAERVGDVLVLELAPGPEDLPAHAADWVFDRADSVAVTASALGNLTLPRLLELACHARVALIGPGTPLTPRLHAYGIAWLSGLVIEDAAQAARIVAEGGAVKALKSCSRRVTLSAEPPDTAEVAPLSRTGSRAR